MEQGIQKRSVLPGGVWPRESKIGRERSEEDDPPSSFLERGGNLEAEKPVVLGPLHKRGQRAVQSYDGPSSLLTSELYSLSISVTAG